MTPSVDPPPQSSGVTNAFAACHVWSPRADRSEDGQAQPDDGERPDGQVAGQGRRPVKEGDTLAEIQTDKAVMPMEAFEEGTVARLDVKEGDEIALGQRMLVLAKKGEDPRPSPGRSARRRRRPQGRAVEAPPQGRRPGARATRGPTPASGADGNGQARPAAPARAGRRPRPGRRGRRPGQVRRHWRGRSRPRPRRHRGRSPAAGRAAGSSAATSRPSSIAARPAAEAPARRGPPPPPARRRACRTRRMQQAIAKRMAEAKATSPRSTSPSISGWTRWSSSASG